MTLKYCQSHKCHTYDTKDRKRGSKGNKTNQTRRRSDLYYGGGNFCSLNCYDDWARDFMDRAIDNVSGRLHEPIILTEENAWNKTRRYNWGGGDNGYTMTYFWRNMVSNEEIEITKEQFESEVAPNL
jgi:hypothetical protein